MRVARGLEARRAHAIFTELGFCCWANEDSNSIVGRIGWTKEIQGVVKGGFGPRLGPWLALVALGPYLTLVPEFLIKKLYGLQTLQCLHSPHSYQSMDVLFYLE
jgi:hypothetical protein